MSDEFWEVAILASIWLIGPEYWHKAIGVFCLGILYWVWRNGKNKEE